MAETTLQTEIQILITVPKGAPFEPIKKGLEEMEAAGDKVTLTLKDASKGADDLSYSMRGLMIDIRMMSYGIRMLSRAVGDNNELMNQAEATFNAVAGGGTFLLISYKMLKQVQSKLTSDTLTFASAFGSLKEELLALAPVLKSVLVPLLLAIAGIKIGQWALDQATGVNRLTGSIKGWEERIEELQKSIKDLKLEQSKLTEETRYYEMQISNLEYAESKMGYQTEDMKRKMTMLEQAIAANDHQMSQLDYSIQRTNTSAKEYNRLVEEGNEAVKETRERFNFWYPSFWGSRAGDVGESVSGGMGVTAEQIGQRMGGINVNVNFPNANFNTGAAVERAMERGAASVARRLEFIRRGIR